MEVNAYNESRDKAKTYIGLKYKALKYRPFATQLRKCAEKTLWV
jgi:hypothetical protein